MDKRKKVIVYGNCHAAIIAGVLKKNEYFNKYYYIYEIPQIQAIKDLSFFETEKFYDCDIFIHQSIQLGNRYGEAFASENVIKLLPKSCEIIAIPNVYHLAKCFFPQYSEAKELRTKIKDKTCFFRDSIIDEAYVKNAKVDEIVEKYNSLCLYDENVLKNAYTEFIEKVKKRENDWDIKVSAFIEENYKDIQLFYDPNHPTNYFLEYVAYKVLCILLPRMNIQFEDVLGTSSRRLDSYEMPVCANAKSALGLNWKEKELRITGIKEKNERMYLREYISQYILREWRNEDIGIFWRIKSFLKWCPVYMKRKIRYIKKKYFKNLIRNTV